MKKLALALALSVAALSAQTSQTVAFRGVMSTANEVPAVNLQASGAATVLVHVVRDNAGQIVSGSVDLGVDYTFPGAATFTGFHLHNGEAGVNGPVTINSGISAANSVATENGRGSINLQAQVRPTDAAALATLNQLFVDPSKVYINLHTTLFPGGAIRAQLQQAELLVLMGLMSPANEVPAVPINASAVSTVWALATRKPDGTLTSGQVIFDINYNFESQVTFSGYHIHRGGAGENGPVTISSGIAAGTQSAANGVGNLRLAVELPLANAAAVSTFDGLWIDPSAYYINIHTTAFPGGVVRAQLRRTDRTRFPVNMLTGNEVPAITDIQANATGEFTAYTLRNADGSVAAGAATFDVNARLPDRAEFTGLHIHDAAAGVNGSVRINSGIGATASVVSNTGSGNIYRRVTISDLPGIASLNSLVTNPENHYINLHTTVNPGGVVRSQLAAANTQKPSVANVISAVSDPALKNVAPGGLMTIFGSNLSKTATDSGGNPTGIVPTALNGTSVTIGGRAAPLIAVRPDYIVAQVPLETPAGPQALAVTNINGVAPSAFTATVASSAPGIYFDEIGGLAVKNDDFSFIRPDNPVRAGDILVVYGTGLGQTVPGLSTGRVVGYPPASVTAAARVTMGGQAAQVLYSIASPGFLGLYQVAVRVPAGLPAGNAPMVLTVGGVASNSVNIAVR